MPITSLAHQLDEAIQRLGHVPAVGAGSSPPLLLVKANPHPQHPSEPALDALRTSAVPVLYAPHYEPRVGVPLRIFAPVDFLRGTEPLLAWVRDLAATLPAEVVLGTVVKPPRAMGELKREQGAVR